MVLTSLLWEDFQSHVSSSFQDLCSTKSFSNVTLVSDDQTQFQAHKSVLSACSPVLKSIFLSNPDTHSLIYLTGVQQQVLQSILEFMYIGEATVSQNYIREFMKVSKRLLLEDVGNIEQIKTDPNHKDVDGVHHDKKETNSVVNTIDEFLNLNNKRYDQMNSGYPLVLGSLTDTDPEIFVVDEGEQNSRTMQNVWESKGYFCNQCEYRSTNQMSLKAHKQSKHDSVIYTGNECEYQTSNKYSLKIQINTNLVVTNIHVMFVSIRHSMSTTLRNIRELSMTA